MRALRVAVLANWRKTCRPMVRKSPSRPYRGRHTDERSAERRQRLLATALEAFGTRGYAGVTIERICSDAKVSTRYFYEHFDSREALLAAVFDQMVDHARTRIVQAFASPAPDAQQRALNALRTFFMLYLGDARFARIGSIETVGVSREMEARRRRAVHELTGIISGAANGLAESGILPRADYHLAAVALVGACNELVVEWLTADTGLSAEQMTKQIVGLFRALIAGAEIVGQRNVVKLRDAANS